MSLKDQVARFVLALCQDSPTRIQGMYIPIIAPGQVIRLSGGPVGQHRKQIVITSDDNVQRLHIVDGNNVDPATVSRKLMTIFPNTSITLFTSAEVVLKNCNPSQNVNDVYILETYYT
jgi:hypothetical protein